jgi:hypothetical protein
MTKHTNLNLFEIPVQQYKGWEVHILENQWLKMYITPELGGRIIQTELDGYGFFFVNPALEGHVPDVDRLGPDGGWMNYGGEKIWPAPQGWDSPDLWPGPPDPVLDSGPYSVNENRAWEKNRIDLTSLPDERTGLQIDKQIELSANRSEIKINAIFTNGSNREREWSVWPVFQLNTADAYLGGRYSITCPVNSESKFDGGYKVMHGLVNNPQFQTAENGHLRVDYQYLVGKVGLDSNANWVAYCDNKTGKVFVTSFEHQKDAHYPENTSVQIWTQGRGMIYSRNKVIEYSDDPVQNPPYLEMELLSPLHQMKPGEQAQFEYRIRMCTLPEQQQVDYVNEYGVVGIPLNVRMSEEGIVSIEGKFGVFMSGTARLTFRDEKGADIKSNHSVEEWEITPLKGFSIGLNREEPHFNQEVWVGLDLYDEQGDFVGELNKTKLCMI